MVKDSAEFAFAGVPASRHPIKDKDITSDNLNPFIDFSTGFLYYSIVLSPSRAASLNVHWLRMILRCKFQSTFQLLPRRRRPRSPGN